MEESSQLMGWTEGRNQQQRFASTDTSVQHDIELVRGSTPSDTLHKRQSQTRVKSFHDTRISSRHSSKIKSTAWFTRAMSIIKKWALEILSCFIGCMSLAAIVWTLTTYDEQPIPKWPLVITINSLIAIFTAVMKAALLMPVAEGICQLKWRHFSNQSRAVIDLNTFDSASRGPWGSFLLMFKAPKQFLASFGALITVVALAIDPFSQQVVQHYTCSQPISGVVATISRTNNYSQAGVTLSSSPIRTMDINMTAAIYQGLYNPAPNASSLVLFDCYAGNCTFPNDNGATHSSLGMCYSYRDLSDTVITNVQKSGGRNFSLPSGATISPMQMLSYRDFGMALSISAISNDSLNLATFDTLTFSTAGCADKSSNSNNCSRPFAFRSSFYPCVRTYSSNITNFILDEAVVQTTPLISPAVLNPHNTVGDWVLATNTTLRNGTRHDCNPTSTQTSQNAVAFSHPPGNGIVQYYPDDCIWIFSMDAMKSFSMGLFWFFNGRNITTLAGPQPGEGDSSFLTRLGHNYTADATSVNQWLTQLTDSMTAAMRRTGDTRPESYATGSVLENQTCIRVRWWWLSLPASLLVLGAAFTCVVVVQSNATPDLPVWKSSDLVLLYHGFRDEVVDGIDVFEGAQDMEKLSTSIRARLVLGENKRWNFEPFRDGTPGI